MLPVSFADSLKHRRFIILVVIACLLLGAAPARAEWHTLQAGHFLIHYPEANRALALDVAVRAEAVHELLTERLGHAACGQDAPCAMARNRPGKRVRNAAVRKPDRCLSHSALIGGSVSSRLCSLR